MSLFFETKRSELPDIVFGVPEQRKFPLDSEEHVRSAIKFFNYVDPKYEKELANNIKKAMKKYNINDVKIGEKNRLSKYIKSTSDKSVKEVVDLSKDLENKRIILDKTISLLSQELGKNVKINKNDENDFLHKPSKKLCFCGLGQNPDHICSRINKEIKPYGGRLKPDNYGTAFLSVKGSYGESSVLEIESMDFILYDHLYADNIETIQEAGEMFTWRIMPILLKALFKGVDQYDYKYLKEEKMPAIVKKCKTMDDIKYLRRDATIAKTQLKILKRNVHAVNSNDEYAMKHLGKSFIKKVQSGKLTEKDIDDYIKWINTGYKKLLDDRAKEIRSSMKESSIDKDYKQKSSVLVIESVEGDKDSYEFYASYRVEPIYKDPSNCCWDEEMYNSNVPDAIVSLINKNKNINSGSFYVYTDMGAGRTKFIGVIDVDIEPDLSFTYKWKDKVGIVKDVMENTANGAMVGTSGNVYISGCMKRNTFENDERMYIIHRDGLNDIFKFDKEGKAKKIKRDDLLKEFEIKETYLFDQHMIDSEEYFKIINGCNNIDECYHMIVKGKRIKESFCDDSRFKSVTPFPNQLDKINRDIFYEYGKIKYKNNSNNSVIEVIDQNIQSLIDSPYCLETEYPSKTLAGKSLLQEEVMVDRLKKLKEIIPTIN